MQNVLLSFLLLMISVSEFSFSDYKASATTDHQLVIYSNDEASLPVGIRSQFKLSDSDNDGLAQVRFILSKQFEFAISHNLVQHAVRAFHFSDEVTAASSVSLVLQYRKLLI
jgi:hypothetical protein